MVGGPVAIALTGIRLVTASVRVLRGENAGKRCRWFLLSDGASVEHVEPSGESTDVARCLGSG